MQLQLDTIKEGVFKGQLLLSNNVDGIQKLVVVIGSEKTISAACQSPA